MKIRATSAVRDLLAELDQLFQEFHKHTATLANGDTPGDEAINVAADREFIKQRILSCAYRINKASRGDPD